MKSRSGSRRVPGDAAYRMADYVIITASPGEFRIPALSRP